MSARNIQLDIILDGIKPKAFIDHFEIDYKDTEGAHVNKYYDYRNFGVEDIIHAVKVAREANCTHNYYFAPYEATPQVYFLHDSYMGANMCAFPDLLMYVWYNFIIDIDLEKEEFEWVKYSKENKLNDKRNLSKMFLNSGYMIQKGGHYKDITVEEIKKRTELCNSEEQYNLKNHKLSDALEVLENPWIMSMNHDIEWIRKNKFHYDNEYQFKTAHYGKRLDKIAYFCLYKGVLTPKMCESMALGKNVNFAHLLKVPAEEEYSKLNVYLNKMALQNITDNDDSKDQDSVSTSAESQITSGVGVDPFIARMLNSEAFENHISLSNEDYINTINLCCKCLKDFFTKEEENVDSADSIVSLKENQIWPYINLHL